MGKMATVAHCLRVSSVALVGMALCPVAGTAETIQSALAAAYRNNPSLNAQRAATRVADEAVAIAKSGWRPTVIASGDVSKLWRKTRIGRSSKAVNQFGIPTGPQRSVTTSRLTPGGFGVTISQSLWDSFKTRNDVGAAKSAVRASQETLRNVEQNVLFDAASAYMDVIRDQAISGFRAKNLAFLNEQVRSERARFEVGESTRTDVAQAEAGRASALAELSRAKGNLQASKAIYRQIIGRDPKNLRKTSGIRKLLPRNLQGSIAIAQSEHPAIRATEFLVDQAAYNVKSSESSLLPTITLQGQLSRRYAGDYNGTTTDDAQITASLNVPIYQAGRQSGLVRQNKETLGQRRIEVDQTVDNVRAAVVSAYSQLEAAISAVSANRTQVRAAELALSGAVEERKVGQRTTLDVLNTQQSLINAQISLVSAEREVVVAGYALMSAIGRLSARKLGLRVKLYDPVEHYLAVKDKWYGLRTPDKR